MILIKKQQKYQHCRQVKLIDEETLPSNQCTIIEQAKFTYSHLGKALEKQIKAIEDQGEKQIKELEEHVKQLVKYSDEEKSLQQIQNKNFF